MDKDMLTIEKIAKKLTEIIPEIDIVLLYGSFARGLGHELSDYDIAGICDTKKVVWHFILNDRVVQVGTKTWENVEATITGETGVWLTAAASLANGIILWEKSIEHRRKFEKIISKVAIGGKITIENALNWFDGWYGKFRQISDNIESGKLVNIRFIRQELANAICYALSGINNQYYLSNWGKQLAEIEEFEIKPENFTERYTELITAEPKRALKIAEELTQEIHKLLIDWLEKNRPPPKETYKDIAKEWSGMIEGLNSIKSAAKKADITGGLFSVFDFTEFVFWAYMILQNKTWERNSFYPNDKYLKKLPEAIRKDVEVLLLSTDLEELAKAAEKITKDMHQRLIAKGATLPIAKTLEEAEQFIQQWDL